MLSFVTAIAIFTFQDDRIQEEIVAAPAGIVLFLLVWEISIHWKSSSGKSGTLWQRIKGRFERIVYSPRGNSEV